MNKNNLIELEAREANTDPLPELPLSSAQKLILQAVEVELYSCLEQHAEHRPHLEMPVLYAIGISPSESCKQAWGPVTVKIPKVRAKTGEPVTFQLALMPPYVRKTRSLEATLPWLYLKGISSGEMGAASSH